MTEQIMNVINEIALKLGVAAEKVFPMLLKQADVFKATYQVGLWVLGISAAVAVVCFVLSLIIMAKSSSGAGPLLMIVVIIAAIVCFFAAIVAVADLQSYMGAVHNPEWWAIEYVTNLLK